MDYADDEKIRLLSWLLPSLGADDIVGSEIHFGRGRFRADLAIISPRRISAIEIKGQRDSIYKLKAQIEGYLAAFNEVTVATAQRHLPFVRRELPARVGIILLGSSVEWIRKPRPRRNLAKCEAAAWLQSKDLTSALGKNYRGEGLQKMRQIVQEQMNAQNLTTFACSSILRRARPRFVQFQLELGDAVTLDDVKMLTLPTNVR